MKPFLVLDLGNQNIRGLVVQPTKDYSKIKIYTVFERLSDGMNKGAINDYGAFCNVLFETFEDINKLGFNPKQVVVNIASPHSNFKITKTTGGVTRGDSQITRNDLVQLEEKIYETHSETSNKIIEHIIPRDYTVDGLTNIKDPIGMHGYRLEMEAAVIEVLNTHFQNLSKVFKELNKNLLISPVFSPLAASFGCLTKKQQNVGTILVDIGAQNTSYIIYEDDKLIDTKILHLGADSITHDIAICLKVPLETAEKIKLTCGYALAAEVSRKENIDVSKISKEIDYAINKRYLAEIIEARLEELFGFINNEIKKNNVYNKLAGGVVLVGGGAKLPGMVDFIKKYLKLPAKIGYPNLEQIEASEKHLDLIDDPSFVEVVGLALFMLAYSFSGKSIEFVKTMPPSDILNKIKKFFKIFLP
ncbi:MAG: cell division protein FtsA [Patescibacteria group bacterium]|jgi:cell division protein FtsA|nr:cell division protein FtsA [Patescibacteria group bacterium]